jgi:streptogramin lyase
LEGFNNTNEVKIGGITFDNSGNLWITNARSSKVLAVKTPKNKWYSYTINSLKNTETIGDIIVDENNFKWITLGKSSGIVVFDDNNTLDNAFDDNSKWLTFPNNVTVSTAVEDKKGYIWFGTEEGIYVNFQPHKIFTSSTAGERIVVSDGTFAENLLENEKILAIAVDGADRKWITTEGAGVFLVSANGKEQLEHFTAENSPLLSNNVRTVAINQNTGEIFFGTDKGIISYKGTATETKKDFSEVLVFPNPVPEGYAGNIGIKGLVDNSNVKITDLQGALVFENEANGGQFVWNGLNFEGQRVVTGVYLVFVTNKDGEQTMATKILIK